MVWAFISYSGIRKIIKVVNILREFFRREKLFVHYSIYLDDMLLLHQSKADGFRIMSKTIPFLKDVGCSAILNKSVLTPSSSVHYLGLDLDIETSTVSIPPDKIIKFHQLISDSPVISTARLKGYFCSFFKPFDCHCHH